MSFIIYPIGDSAITIELGADINEAHNRKIIAMQTWLKINRSKGLKEITIAYSSLAIHYNILIIRKLTGKHESIFEYISNLLKEAYEKCQLTVLAENIIKIPVCYHASLGLDLEYISKKKYISIEEIIRLHISKIYRVYMIGFLPGFPYMAEVDEQISIDRKDTPRPLVSKGSVGIAGRQTGIYPLASPGGWQIIGRTPFRLFDPYGPEVVPLSPGDQVQFSPISLEEFYQLNN